MKCKKRVFTCECWDNNDLDSVRETGLTGKGFISEVFYEAKKRDGSGSVRFPIQYCPICGEKTKLEESE